ncbi:MAG TPA: FecR domain-containing protein [Puia sp.]|nr:FecR domain-containing protein [Puia sp.]
MDFIQDTNFIRWVREKKPADNEYWEGWLAQHPDKHSLIAEARRVLESIEIPQKIISPKEIQQETQRLLEAIGIEVSAAGTDDRPAPMTRGARKWWLAAAVLAPLAVGIFYFSRRDHSTPQKFAYSSLVSSRHLIERVNNSEKTDTLLFPDGSLVRLSPNSRISYPAGFDTASVREVYLSGQAFFQVVKNPRHPFRVIAGEVVTKVLGTSFCVRSFEKDTTIQVVVRTGKVSVYSQAIPGEPVNLPSGHSVSSDSRGEIILTCNQRLVYKKTAQKFQKLLLESPTLVTPGMTDETMVYEDTPLEEVFTRLSKAYGINIVYDSELIKKSTVTADLKGETFYHKLDLICRAIGADYEVIDGQVVISFSNTKPNLNE